jgi:glycosyltransferase involved in cell wall biosynthesis
MIKPSFFSVVIPALNEEHYLPQLLLDLSNQTFRDFEVIIVDAKSDDQTISRAQQFEDKFDRLLILESDKRNVSHQRNLGAQKALADWLIFFDADDRLPGYFVQEIKDLVEVGKPDLLSTWFEPDSEDIKDKAIATLDNIAIEIYKNTQNPLVREAFVCVKKEAFLSLGGFDETVSLREGGELLKRAYRSKMIFMFHKDPKFVSSFRRLRKQGALRTLINSVQIEFARLTNHHISEERSRILYPMKGGKYFEKSTSQLDESNRDSLRNVLKRIFKPL